MLLMLLPHTSWMAIKNPIIFATLLTGTFMNLKSLLNRRKHFDYEASYRFVYKMLFFLLKKIESSNFTL